MSLAKNLFEVMKFTKHEMKCAYQRKERDTIEYEYHSFRVYLRFLIIRGGIHADKRELFDYVKNRQCVLFFDEFDTIAKERGDKHETGEIKRVVSSLLLHIDELPSYVVAIAATNHDQLLDQAVWRRFQIKLELPRPNEAQIETYLKTFQNRVNFDFGIEPKKLANILKNKSYAEIKEFALSVYRQYILSELNSNAKAITERQIQLSQLSFQD